LVKQHQFWREKILENIFENYCPSTQIYEPYCNNREPLMYAYVKTNLIVDNNSTQLFANISTNTFTNIWLYSSDPWSQKWTKWLIYTQVTPDRKIMNQVTYLYSSEPWSQEFSVENNIHSLLIPNLGMKFNLIWELYLFQSISIIFFSHKNDH
jgi:hypothetical protein